MNIVFNKPYVNTNLANKYIADCISTGKISGDGKYTKLCEKYFESNFGVTRALITTSCTDALEMSAILLDIKPGDEVIMPSFTFVSTSNAFILRGATVVFCDSNAFNPNIDEDKIEELVTKNTKAIVVVHYAGVACNMDKIMSIANKYNIAVVEDAAQAICSKYKGKYLGTFGTFGTFSFHETKNASCGEGGMLCINDEKYVARAEIIREKGTNRAAFFRGQVDKYGWVDIGSSYLPSDITAALLYSQLVELDEIQDSRRLSWLTYYYGLAITCNKSGIKILDDNYTSHSNYHLFALVMPNENVRTAFLKYMKDYGIMCTFHFQSLHKSKYFADKYHGKELVNSDMFSNNLVRLPLYNNMSESDLCYIIDKTISFIESL